MELLKVVGDIILCTMILGTGIIFVISNVTYRPEEGRDND